MGILNVTPDSFSGDGLIGASDPDAGGDDPVDRAVTTGPAMVDEGADLLDIGGESTRPGHAPVDVDEERRRVVPVIAAVRAALPDVPISIDTTKPAVAEAGLAAGADLINDVWGVGADDALAAARRRRTASRSSSCTTGPSRATTTLLAEVVADLAGVRSTARSRLGVARDD